MVDIRVIDTDFAYLANIDTFSSLQWSRKLWEVGSFELHVPGATELQCGRILIIDEHRAGIITGLEFSETSKGVELVARGSELKGLVSRRITVPGRLADTQYFGYDRYPALDAPDAPAESVIKHYIDLHMVHPSDANRVLPRLDIAPDLGRGILMRWSSRFEAIGTALKGIGEQSGMGYDIAVDLSGGRYIFDVIEGVDRTVDSDTPVIFSVDWGNVENTKYTEDEKGWANASYAGGAGEDEARLVQTVFEQDTIPTGFDRREAWVDCGSIDLVDDLIYEAKHKQKDKIFKRTLTGDIARTGPFAYREDWDLGDIVTVQSTALDVSLPRRITEVKESYTQGKEDINITFGDRQKNLLDEIRRLGGVIR